VKHYPGQLVPSYIITCGMCNISKLDSVPAQTRRQAGDLLRKEMWASTRAWGWICPRCDQFGSPGVVPRIAPRAATANELFEQGKKILEDRKNIVPWVPPVPSLLPALRFVERRPIRGKTWRKKGKAKS
jgi:hypothetical protein